jgi:DNA polymerase-3 subunit epsilon/ATP-dependent DNA helicase DinG
VLGTAAFWEGVDVPGDALSQIAIARLPFPVPTDPVYAGRAERFQDPFADYALPQAVLRFRQGFGRLIRRATDRGVFLIADSRAARREYGQVFLDGLPDTELRFMRQDDVAAAVRDWLSR